MPIDRIDRTDPNLYRVDKADDRGGRGRQQQNPEGKKDKFDKKVPVWKRILSMNSRAPKSSPLLTEKPKMFSTPSSTAPQEEQDEESLTFSERLLVVWGVLEPSGRPRPVVILIYTLILGMIVGASLLIIGMTLWQ